MVISVERYVAIVYPMLNRRLARLRIRHIVTTLIWLVSLIYSSPLTIIYDVVVANSLTYGETLQEPYCVRVIAVNMTSYVTINFVLWYCTPLILLTVVYGRIAQVLCKAVKPKEEIPLLNPPITYDRGLTVAMRSLSMPGIHVITNKVGLNSSNNHHRQHNAVPLSKIMQRHYNDISSVGSGSGCDIQSEFLGDAFRRRCNTYDSATVSSRQHLNHHELYQIKSWDSSLSKVTIAEKLSEKTADVESFNLAASELPCQPLSTLLMNQTVVMNQTMDAKSECFDGHTCPESCFKMHLNNRFRSNSFPISFVEHVAKVDDKASTAGCSTRVAQKRERRSHSIASHFIHSGCDHHFTRSYRPFKTNSHDMAEAINMAQTMTTLSSPTDCVTNCAQQQKSRTKLVARIYNFKQTVISNLSHQVADQQGKRPSKSSLQEKFVLNRLSNNTITQRRRKVIRLHVAVITSFALCMLPYQVIYKIAAIYGLY